MNQHLPTTRLGDHVAILSGFAFKSDRFNTDRRGLPLVRIRDVTRGYSETFYDGPFDEQFLVSDGDLLVGMDGEFNRERWNGGRSLLNQRVCRLLPNADVIDRDYLFHLLPGVLKKIEDATPFVTVKHLSVNELRAVQLVLPPLEEQQRIAAVLDKADALRQKRKRAIALLDSLTQSIFLEMFESREWPQSTLGDITAEFRYGTSEKSGTGGYPTLRIPNVAEGDISLEDVKTVDVPSREFERLSLKVGDLLFVRTNGNREYVGRSAVVDERISQSSGLHVSEFIFASYLIRARVVENLALPHFVQAYLSSSGGRKSLLERCKTSAGQFNINTESLASIPVPLPDLQLQQQFVDRVYILRTRKKAWAASHSGLDGLFASLQQRAFEGDGLGT